MGEKLFITKELANNISGIYVTIYQMAICTSR